MRPCTEERLASKYVIDDSGCWLWTGTRNASGYGEFWYGQRLARAHRASYELHVGPIPEGLTLDHLCRVRACVNPGHLEPVTLAENIRRAALAQTHCVNGHPWDAENTHVRPTGARACRACGRAAKLRWQETHCACPRCGGPMEAPGGALCRCCRGDDRAARAVLMMRLRAEEGLTNRQISERVGKPLVSVRQELGLLRALGFSVPYEPGSGIGHKGPRKITKDAENLARTLAKRGITPEAVAA